jgi:hypothetical protein
VIGGLLGGLLFRWQVWREVRAENRHTRCCWCLRALDPLDALATFRRRRLVHPACLPEADAEEEVPSWGSPS